MSACSSLIAILLACPPAQAPIAQHPVEITDLSARRRVRYYKRVPRRRHAYIPASAPAEGPLLIWIGCDESRTDFIEIWCHRVDRALDRPWDKP